MLRMTTYLFLVFSGISLTGFYFPLYFQYKGLSTSQIGLVMALSALVTIIAQPIWGLISDRLKTAKKVIIGLMLASLLLSTALFAVHGMLAIALLLCLMMFFTAGVTPLSDSLTINYAVENGRNYGAFRLWGEIGVGLTALAAGWYIVQFGMDNFQYFFYFVFALALLASLFIRDARTKQIPVSKESLKKMFSNKAFLWLLVLVLILATPHRMNDSFLSIYLGLLDAPETMVGNAWLIGTLSGVPALALMARMTRRYGEYPLFLIAAFLYIIRWSLIGFGNDPIILVWSQVLHGWTFPLFFVCTLQLINRMVPPELKATGQAMLAAIFGGLAGIIGSAVGGWAIDQFGPQTLYLSGAVISAIGLVIAWITFYKMRFFRAAVNPYVEQPVGIDVVESGSNAKS